MTVKERLQTYQNFVEGRWLDPQTGDFRDIRDPANGQVVHRVPASDARDVDAAVRAARRAFEGTAWGEDMNLRARALHQLSHRVEDQVSPIGEILTSESGALLSFARGQVQRFAETTDYFEGITRWLYGRSITPTENSLSVMLHEPVGVVGIIVPWNAPVALLARALAPALAAGNAVVIKPSSYTAGSTAELVRLMGQIGELPPGIVNLVIGSGEQAGQALVEHPGVDMISFTGDTSTGKQIMRTAAETLKRVSLELGGKSPTIVFGDADFDRAIKGAMNGASFYHAGQICIAGTRVLVEEAIHQRFIDRVREMLPKIKVGDPREKGVACGPVINQTQLERVLDYIETGKREAKLVGGGERLSGDGYGSGYFIQPAVFDEVPEEAAIAREEIFGPVMSVLSFKDVEDALRLANATSYGLVAAVYSSDINKAMRLARKVRAGTVWINTFGKLYQNTEMGGFKQSGLGRQYGLEGILEYTELKHINIQW